jgi:predicted MFS family arabinose efflux permease
MGSFVSGLMMDRWGRRRVLQLCVVPLTLGWVMIAVAQSHVFILTGRIMAGFAVGLSAAPGQVGNLPSHQITYLKIIYLLSAI